MILSGQLVFSQNYIYDDGYSRSLKDHHSPNQNMIDLMKGIKAGNAVLDSKVLCITPTTKIERQLFNKFSKKIAQLLESVDQPKIRATVHEDMETGLVELLSRLKSSSLDIEFEPVHNFDENQNIILSGGTFARIFRSIQHMKKARI
mmetsp:Transcript_41647/g.37040  ORF Transcript_41647/g.37040 Transcript_41647/m.37040 type:complete len:147 (+) Transcript_41647:1768-2208(+)